MYRFVTYIFAFFISASCFAQDVYYKQFEETDGLPSMTCYEMVQDDKGVLWIGTESGLVSYDGEAFTSYYNSDLKDNDIIKTSLDLDGSVLFTNLSNQLIKLKDGKMDVLYQSSSNKFNLVSSSNRVYVIEKEYDSRKKFNISVSELINESLELRIQLKTDVKNLSEKKRINMVSSTEDNIFYENVSDTIHFYKSGSRALDYNDEKAPIHNYGFYPNQWFHIDKMHLNVKTDDGIKGLIKRTQLISTTPDLRMRYTEKGTVNMVRYDSTFYLIFPSRLERYDAKTGKSQVLLEEIEVNTVMEDRSGNLWVSTRESGLISIPNTQFKVYSFEEKGQKLTGVYSNDEYLLYLWGDKFEVRNTQGEIILEKDLKTEKKSSIEPIGNSFIISSYGSFVLLQNGREVYFSTGHYRLPGPAKAVKVMDGYIYYSTLSSIFRSNISINKNSLTISEEDKEYTLTNTKSIYHSENQNLLLAGGSNGLFVMNDEEFTPYAPELQDANVSCLIEYQDSSFWVSTRNKGLYKIKNQKVIEHFDVANGLLSNNINNISFQDNYLYAATTNGASRINILDNSIVNRNSENGLPFDQITNLTVFNDSIWMAIQKQVVAVDTSFFSNENTPPILSLDKVFINSETYNYENGIHLDYDQNNIEITLKNVSLNSSRNKSIKYKIRNRNSSWITSSEPVIRLPVLKPGKYHIEAIGLNALGIPSAPLALFFTIDPPWWNTTWAQMLALAIIFFTAYLIILYRGRRIRKEEALKRDYITQINKIKDQALQLQMNPHFIFNSLNAIQGFIGTEDEEQAMNYLARFARLIRLIFEHSKGNTISLEEEFEFIRLYLDLEKLRFSDKVEITFNIDEKLEEIKDVVRVPPLLIQPIIENSFKHGLFHKKGKGVLTINYWLNNEVLIVTVEDNGIGRVESARIAKKNIEKQQSSGIKTTEERIALLNFGKERKENKITIEDLKDKDGNGLGTKVTIQLKIDNSIHIEA